MLVVGVDGVVVAEPVADVDRLSNDSQCNSVSLDRFVTEELELTVAMRDQWVKLFGLAAVKATDNESAAAARDVLAISSSAIDCCSIDSSRSRSFCCSAIFFR